MTCILASLGCLCFGAFFGLRWRGGRERGPFFFSPFFFKLDGALSFSFVLYSCIVFEILKRHIFS